MPENKNQHLKIFELFGASTDSKVEEQIKMQYAQYKNLVKKLQSSSYHYSRISKAYTDINNNIDSLNAELSQDDCPQVSQKAALVISEIVTNLNTKISEMLGEYADRINCFLNMYTSAMKKKYEKFMESLESAEHYRQKMKSLHKGSRESNRYERNKTKWDSAEEDFKEISTSFFKTIQNVGSEGTKMLSECFHSCLFSLTTNYQKLESELSLNISALEESHSRTNGNFAQFLGHEQISNPPNNKLSFAQMTNKFLNKNYNKQNHKVTMRLENYFKNLPTKSHFDLVESTDTLVAAKSQNYAHLYKSCNGNPKRQSQRIKENFGSKEKKAYEVGRKSETGKKGTSSEQIFNNFENVLSRKRKQESSNNLNIPHTIRLKNCEQFLPEQKSVTMRPKKSHFNEQKNRDLPTSSGKPSSINLLDL